MHIAIWLTAAVLLGLWSLVAWGLATLMAMDPSWVGEVNLLLLKWPFGDWFDQWLPGWQAGVSALLDVTQTLLSWLGSVGPWLTLAIWAAGAACIVVAAGLFSVLVAVVRRATRPGPALNSATAVTAGAR